MIFGTKFEHSQCWSNDVWKSKMAGGGGNKKIFRYCTDSSGEEILCFRALQGDSGRNPSDLTLQENVLIPNNFFEYIYHIGCTASQIQDLYWEDKILAGTDRLFFTAVNPMHKNHRDPQELDLTKRRLAWYKQKWKRHQETVFWVDLQLAQTRSNAIILFDTLPVYCISKAIVMKTEVMYKKVYVSPRTPPKNSYKDNWMCDFNCDVARSSRDIQRIELKTNTQLTSTGRLVTKRSEETLERTEFDHDTLNQEKHDNVTDPTSTLRPVCGHEYTERCVLTPEHVERDQTSTERPVTVDQTLISECQDCHRH